jgi:hypothetical protein
MERELWEQKLSSDIGIVSTIQEQGSSREFSVAAERLEYLPLDYIEPPAIHRAFFGVDIMTTPERQRVLQKVVESGHPTLIAQQRGTNSRQLFGSIPQFINSQRSISKHGAISKVLLF